MKIFSVRFSNNIMDFKFGFDIKKCCLPIFIENKSYLALIIKMEENKNARRIRP